MSKFEVRSTKQARMTEIENSKEIKPLMQPLMKKRLAGILRKQHVVLAYLFGSQANGRAGPLSDIDMAVYFDETIRQDERFDLRLAVLGELIDRFKTDEIDLIVLNDAPPLLAHRILKEGLLIFSDDDKIRLEFEIKAVLKYLDWKPYLEKYTRQVFSPSADYGR